MKPYPPVLLIGIDSETEPNPLDDEPLSWSSPHGAILDYATVIAVLYDPDDVYDVKKVRKGFPRCNLTKTATERFSKMEELGFKRVTTLIYSSEKVGNVERWEKNLKDGYVEKASEVYGLTDEKVVRVLAGELMKRDITRDIVEMMDRVKYSMLLAQNVNYDYTTMVSKQVLDKNGWVEAFYTRTSLNAGGYLKSPDMRFGDFLGVGSFGLLFKKANTHVKTAYVVDLFGHVTYALVKSSHFVRFPKLHPGNLDRENYTTNADRVIAYNVRDVEILIDLIAHFPEIIGLSVVQIETTYALLKSLGNLSLGVNKEIYDARYRGKTAVEFTKKIREREPGYNFQKYLKEVFDGETV